MRFDVADLAAFQETFLDAITQPDKADHPGLSIHRDTWFLGLLGTLSETYEAGRTALGDGAFKAFARDYIRAHPLASGDRNNYGADLASFVAAHPHLPFAWLPDLLRFEWALHLAHHARDAEPAEPAEPADFGALLAPEARVNLHPSARILSLDHDIKALHRALIDGTEPPPVRAFHCDLLIARDRDDVAISLCLAPYEAAFLDMVTRRHSLAEAIDRLQPNPDDMTILQALLARLVAAGLLITF